MQRGATRFPFWKNVGWKIKDDHRPPFMAHDIAPICGGFNVPICETTVSTIGNLYMKMEV